MIKLIVDIVSVMERCLTSPHLTISLLEQVVKEESPSEWKQHTSYRERRAWIGLILNQYACADGLHLHKRLLKEPFLTIIFFYQVRIFVVLRYDWNRTDHLQSAPLHRRLDNGLPGLIQSISKRTKTVERVLGPLTSLPNLSCSRFGRMSRLYTACID